ncbi:hypothetical protein QMO56_00780 [Roseomonas sp. E05]|uniref:hypothetical protein n=1 Tax=Roseomonas sp. E05 TaxID=3046310 RepID=UPI0024BA27F2|nr:hypothetical protein [Roseomonas sp. E05]MDJ0386632.1 hypothetical protein [Roseomonas sp. E05]
MVAPDDRADDIIYSLSGDDFVEARGGTDLIAPGPGNDRIEGGDSRDTILLSGSLGDYQLFRHDNEAIIRGPEGVDQLLDVEAVRTDISGTRDLSDVPEFSSYAYLASYPDLAEAYGATQLGLPFSINEEGAWAHFYLHGAYEGRSVTFDEYNYVAANTDLIGSSMYGLSVENGPALHYLTHGRAEGRTTDFDGVAYIASYVDLINGYGNAGDAAAVDAAGAQHFAQFGFQEGRQTDLFNEAAYSAQNPDLAAGGLMTEEQLALHWVQHGIFEGRTGAYDPVIA